MKKYIFIIGIILVIFFGGYLATKNTPSMNHNDMMMGDQPAAQSHPTYSLKLTSQATNLQPNQQTTITYKIVDEKGNVLKDFALDHTKLMHFIVVRKDLQDFQHIHPDFNKDTGEFTIPVTFPETGTYRLFADFTPENGEKDAQGNILGVTPYQDVNVGNISQYTPQVVTPDTQSTKTVGNFQIMYSLPSQVKTGTPTTIGLSVSRSGQAVTDMQQYLGALANGILLKKDSLDFAHLHDGGTSEGAMNMGEMNMGTAKMTKTGPDISFTYSLPSSGIYKLFTQFQEGGNVITTDYTLQVN